MTPFTRSELEEIDALWRRLPASHVWTGWASAGEAPGEIWLFRTRAHWRRFSLRKVSSGYVLFDANGRRLAGADSLAALLERVETVPGLSLAQTDPSSKT